MGKTGGQDETARNRNWALAVSMVGVFLAVLDSALFPVALPSIAAGLDVDPAVAIWTINAYQFTLVVALLPLASLGELLGYRKLFTCGLVLMALGGLAAAMSPSLEVLTAARVVQGLGASAIYSVNLAVVRFVAEPARFGRAIARNSMTTASASSSGPAIAGLLLTIVDWRWLFFAPVVVASITALFSWQMLPDGDRRSRGFAVGSALLSAIAIGALVLAATAVAHQFSWLSVAGILIVAGVSGMLLVRREAASAAPVLPVDLFAIPAFTFAVTSSIISFISQSAALVVLPFHLLANLGFGVAAAGLLVVPWPAAMVLSAPIVARLAERLPAAPLCGGGLVMVAAGLVWIAHLSEGASFLSVAVAVALCGVGYALFQLPNNKVLLSAGPRDRAAGASGMLSTARTLGQAGGAALAAFFLSRWGTEGLVAALHVAAAFALVSALISVMRGSDPR